MIRERAFYFDKKPDDIATVDRFDHRPPECPLPCLLDVSTFPNYTEGVIS